MFFFFGIHDKNNFFYSFQLKIELDEVFNESGANMSVISSSHCSDASGEGKMYSNH